MAHVQVKVVNQFGTFDGKITLAANGTKADADKVVLNLINGINTIKTLSIESEDGSATVFGEAVLRESILTVAAVE